MFDDNTPDHIPDGSTPEKLNDPAQSGPEDQTAGWTTVPASRLEPAHPEPEASAFAESEVTTGPSYPTLEPLPQPEAPEPPLNATTNPAAGYGPVYGTQTGAQTGTEAGTPPPPPPPNPRAAGPDPVYPPPSQPFYAPPAVAGLSSNAAAAIAYLTFIPAVIFLIMAPYNRDRFVRFHAWQCIALTIIMVAVGIVFSVLGFVSPYLLFHLLHALIDLVLFVLWLIAIIKASQGQWYKLPLIGDLAETIAGKA